MLYIGNVKFLARIIFVMRYMEVTLKVVIGIWKVIFSGTRYVGSVSCQAARESLKVCKGV